MSNLVKRMDLRRAKAALPWIPRAFPPHPERRAVPPARPAPFLRSIRFAPAATLRAESGDGRIPVHGVQSAPVTRASGESPPEYHRKGANFH